MCVAIFSNFRSSLTTRMNMTDKCPTKSVSATFADSLMPLSVSKQNTPSSPMVAHFVGRLSHRLCAYTIAVSAET